MKRILVIGVSPGAGKTTFARKLSESTHIPVYHLDSLHWKSGWVEASKEEFEGAQSEIVKGESWIIEGNYTHTLSIRLPHADTIIYIERPLWTCLYRVIKRTLKYKGKSRPEMREGCPDHFSWSFIHFILTTYFERKKEYERLLPTYESEYGINVITCKTRKEEEMVLKNLQTVTTERGR